MTKEMPLTEHPPTDAATFNLNQVREEDGEEAYKEALDLHNKHLSAFNKMSKATPSLAIPQETNSKWSNVRMDELRRIHKAKISELARLKEAMRPSTPKEIDAVFKGIRDETYEPDPQMNRYSKMTTQQTEALKKHLENEIASLQNEIDPFDQDTLN